MELPPQQECTVSSTLGIVLRVTKIYGLAPLKFESVRDGWRISLSRFACVYSKTALVVVCFLGVSSLTLDFCLKAALLVHNQPSSFIIVSVISMSSIWTILLVQAYTGTHTKRNLITCLAQLQKVNAELCHYAPHKSYENKQRLMAAWSLIGGHFLVILDYSLFFQRALRVNGNFLVMGVYVFFHVALITAKVLVLQFSLIHTTVLASFNHLNDCLMKLLQQIRKESSDPKHLIDSQQVSTQWYAGRKPSRHTLSITHNMAGIGDSINKSTDSDTEMVHRIGFLYCSLGDVVQQMDSCNGVVLVVIFMYLLMHLVITPFKLIGRLFGDNVQFDRALSSFAWSTYHFVDLILSVEPCHRTYKQMDRTKYLISQLMLYTPPERHELMFELQLFFKHLMRGDVFYAPLKIFKLNRGIMATIVGSITTYIVVFIQL